MAIGLMIACTAPLAGLRENSRKQNPFNSIQRGWGRLLGLLGFLRFPALSVAVAHGELLFK